MLDRVWRMGAGVARLGACAALVGVTSMAAPAAGAAEPDYADHPTVGAVGTAAYHGSTAGMRLNARIIDMVTTASGEGYWLLAQDGGVFSYGDARFHGSTGSLTLNEPVRAMAVTASGQGYWFVASDGGVFAFGDAGFVGSIPGVLAPGQRLNAPIVGLVPTASGQGYWMVASDGGVFAFGDAFFVGSLGGQAIPDPIVAFVATATNEGYWMVDRKGVVYAFGDAAALGFLPICAGACTIFGDPDVADAVASADGAGLWALWDDGRVVGAGTARWIDPGDVDLEYGPDQQPVALDVDGDTGFWVASTGQYVERGDPGASTRFELIDGRRWSPCLPITWFHNPANAPPGGRAMFADAFAYFAELTGLPFRYGGETTADPSSNRHPGTVVVGWSFGIPPGGWAQSGSAMSTYGVRRAWGWVELDARQVATRPPTFRPGGFGGIALHEIAHVIGLGHPPTMDRDLLMANAPRGHVGDGDRAGLAHLDDRHGC